MFTEGVRFEGWTPTDWGRFLSLWKVAAPTSVGDEEQTPRGGLVLVHDGGRIRKALHTLDGRVDPEAIPRPRELEEVARNHGGGRPVSRVWALHSGALEELMERWGARVRRGDDALTQALLLFGAFRELLDEGAIGSWPRRLKNVPVPTRAVVDRAIDSVVPAGKSALIALYDDGELWTAIVLRRSASPLTRFDVVAGPAELRREMGLVSGDFRRDYRHLVDAVEAIYAPVSVGLHAEVSTFRVLITKAKPGDWARAVGMRDIVVSPLPGVLAVPLGVDATRGVIELATRLAKQVDPIGVVQPMLRMLGHALPHLPELPAGLRASPGFDALDALRKLLNR